MDTIDAVVSRVQTANQLHPTLLGSSYESNIKEEHLSMQTSWWKKYIRVLNRSNLARDHKFSVD